MKLLDIINSITGGKATKRTAAELRASLAEIDLAALERAVAEIERKRRGLLLTGTDSELLAITQDLTAANLEAERAQALSDELTRLIAEADEREHRENVEAQATKAQTAQADGLRLLVALDAAAVELCALLDQYGKTRESIRAANRIVAEAGRGDLKVPTPEVALATHLGLSTPENLSNPLHWQLPGYGTRNPDGLIVGQGKHRLGRASELLPTAARRAA